MSFTSFEFSVPAEYDKKPLKVFLRKYCGLSQRTLVMLKNNELGVTRSGILLKTVDTVHCGDVIRISLLPEKNEIVPVKGELDILYEDDYLLIVNKPSDMPVHPTKIHQLDTLANIVSDYQKKRGESYIFRALNRLDKDTSGCVLIAKDRVTYGILCGHIQKEYIAVCEGVISSVGTVDMPISLREDSKIIREVSGKGQRAVTHYTPITSSENHTLLSLTLETGRTHQIRCHMSYIGHPLAGDDLYGGSLALITRQALHCRKTAFVHPFSKQNITIDSGIPEAFDRIIKEDS